jgi:hypothetical protein
MNFNQNDMRNLREHQRDLARQAERERLAREAKQHKAQTSQRRSTPLWTRLWALF